MFCSRTGSSLFRIHKLNSYNDEYWISEMGCPEKQFSMTSVNTAIHIHVILGNARLVHLWLLEKDPTCAP